MQPLIQVFTHRIKHQSIQWRAWSESWEIPHAKSTHKTSALFKKTTPGLMRIWAHRWLQKSFKYLSKVSHGWLPHCLLHTNAHFSNVFSRFSLRSNYCIATMWSILDVTWKITENAILAHFASHWSHKRFWYPKKADFLPLQSWGVLGTHFRGKHPSMCTPASL